MTFFSQTPGITGRFSFLNANEPSQHLSPFSRAAPRLTRRADGRDGAVLGPRPRLQGCLCEACGCLEERRADRRDQEDEDHLGIGVPVGTGSKERTGSGARHERSWCSGQEKGYLALPSRKQL